jgi:hypothetical protein
VLRCVLLALLVASSTIGAVWAEPALYVHAEDRSAGSRRDAATALARTLLRAQWPATVDQVRVDGVNGHQVAGIVLSGVKFHRALGVEGFLGEVASLVARSFASSDVEEVDVWATAPIPVPKGAIVSGDLAVPTAKTVFGCTVLRDALPHLDTLLHSAADVYWEPAFAQRLRASDLTTPRAL